MKNKYLYILFLFILFFNSCSVFAAENVPYLIQGELSTEESEIYDFMGFNFFFKNKGEKTISKLTVVFYVFDENGEPPFGMKNHIVLNINCNIEPNEIIEDCISLDDFIFSFESSGYVIDYLYISQILYDDGAVWTDSFGVFATY